MESLEPIVAIVGQTGSGKSAMAMKLAQKLGGEIVCADSRTIYRELDIGSAKPSLEDQKKVPHHCLDLVDPSQSFNVADFKQAAEASIEDIRTRSKLPILVGGSGLYIDSVLYDFKFAGADAPRDEQNPRHVNGDVPRLRKDLPPGVIILGLEIDSEELKFRLVERVEQMISAGMADEVRELYRKYPGSKALLAPGYLAFKDYLSGSISIAEAKELFVRNDMKLAKRQRTWFKRNKNIHWIQTYEQADKLVHKFLLRDDTIV